MFTRDGGTRVLKLSAASNLLNLDTSRMMAELTGRLSKIRDY